MRKLVGRRYRHIYIIEVGLIGLLVACCNLADAEARHRVTVDDLLSLKSVDWQMEVSPDGETLAYVVNETNGETLQLINMKEGSSRTIGQGTMPRWSPDGTRLAFYSARGGTLQLWILNFETNEITQITNLARGINPNPLARFTGWVRDPLRYCWSPDGSKIVFTSQIELRSSGESQLSRSSPEGEHRADANGNTNRQGIPFVLTTTSPLSWGLSGVFRADYLGARYVDGKFVTAGDPESARIPSPAMADQLFLVDVASKTTMRFTQNVDDYFNPDWSPDGKKIVCVSTEGKPLIGYGPGSSNLYVIDVQSRRMTALTTGSGEKRLPRWSSDGRWIAYLGGKHLGRQAVYVVSSVGGDPLDITARLDRNVMLFYWTPNGRSVVIGCIDGVSWPIVQIHVPNGQVKKLTTREAAYLPFTVSRTGTLVWVRSDGSNDGVLYAADSEAQNAQVLLYLNPQIAQWSLGKQEVVRWKNSRGEEIEGILIKPIDYRDGKKYPLIVDPYSFRSNGFADVPMLANQALASRGYALFFPNHRAPHMVQNLMKNEAYSEVARGPKGVDIMVDDVMTGIDTLVDRGIADPARMCLYGFSNGGGSTNLLVTRTSRFKCAVSAAGVLSDWSLTFFLGAVGSTVPDLIGGEPWQNPEAYISLSAVYHLDKVATPMLLAVGDRDVHALLLNLEMYYGLRYLGRDVTLLRYPNQGHGFTGPALEDYWKRVNAFFDKYLKPEEPPR